MKFGKLLESWFNFAYFQLIYSSLVSFSQSLTSVLSYTKYKYSVFLCFINEPNYDGPIYGPMSDGKNRPIKYSGSVVPFPSLWSEVWHFFSKIFLYPNSVCFGGEGFWIDLAATTPSYNNLSVFFFVFSFTSFQNLSFSS